jgi:hypothetical protein
VISLQEDHLLVKITDNGNKFGKRPKVSAGHQSLSGTIAKERLDILARENKMNANVEIVPNEHETNVFLTLPVITGHL